MMDEAVGEGHLYGAPSVVYPGLSAMQALRFVLEGFLASFPRDEEAQAVMRVHPRVEIRIRQVCANKIGKGEPPADESIAAIFFLSHPEDRPEQTFKTPLALPETVTEKPATVHTRGKRKFI